MPCCCDIYAERDSLNAMQNDGRSTSRLACAVCCSTLSFLTEDIMKEVSYGGI